MNRERTSYVLPFSCWVYGQPVLIGRIGRADWSIIAQGDEIQIQRSDSTEKVIFDLATVCYSHDNASEEFRSSETLNAGEGCMFFSFRGVLPFTTINGYQGNIRVYSNALRVFDYRNMGPTAESVLERRCGTLSEVTNDFLHLLDDPESFSDAILRCGDVEMPVHKCILSARSPVFAAMFKNEMQEGREGIVEIVDMEPDVLRAMLVYMYGGKDDHLNTNLAEDLLFSADKYQLEGLKKACINVLKSNVTRENIFRYLVLGDMHDRSLKDKAVEFLCNSCHFSKLETTEEWKMLREERPVLAMDVLAYIIKYVQDKWHPPSDQSGWYGYSQPIQPLLPPPRPPPPMPPLQTMQPLQRMQPSQQAQPPQQMQPPHPAQPPQPMQLVQPMQLAQPMQFARAMPLRPGGRIYNL